MSLCALLAAGAALLPAAAAQAEPIASGRDIIVDGRFEPAEWADAARIPLGLGIALTMKRFADRMLLGIALPAGQLRYIDLYVQDATGRRLNLHASMQQGERRLPEGDGWTDADPPFVWGPTPDWHTSIVARSGAPPEAPFAEQVRPYDGFEMAIPFAHLGPGPWRIRLEVRDFQGSAADIAWPAGSSRHDSRTWQAVAPARPLTSH